MSDETSYSNALYNLSTSEFGSFLNQKINRDGARKIHDEVQRLLLGAIHDASEIKGITFDLKGEHFLMGAALSKILRKFCTQKIGGFIVQKEPTPTQDSVAQELVHEINKFDGLVFGVEAPSSSRVDEGLQPGKQPHPDSKHGELTVYDNTVLVSEQFKTLLGFYENRTEKVQRALIQYFTHRDKAILIGHMSSGTGKKQLDKQNRKSFLRAVRTVQTPDMISFWDANFDVTLRKNIEKLQEASTNLPFQFVIPLIQVKKKRVYRRPFENNQLMKGEGKGKEWGAESMIAVVPRKSEFKLSTLSRESAFANRHQERVLVIQQGKCFILQGHKMKKCKPKQLRKEFKTYIAFDNILLDHVTVQIAIGAQNYCFHNFMDFKGDRGVGPNWYDRTKLEVAEQKFCAWLLKTFPIVDVQ